jgi:uncharacterized protein (DUF433 family)
MYPKAISTEYIIIDPEIRFGKPHIIGTRMTVEDIAVMHLKMGQPLEEIARDYNLSFALIQAAMAYYYKHQEEIDRRRSEGKAWAEELQHSHPSLLQKKLRTLESERENSISPR